MNRMWLGVMITAGLLPACGTNETKEARQAETTAPATEPVRENRARQLVSRMMSEAATQAEIGRLAATRAGDKEIRTFGADVAQDHARLSQELTGIAAQFGSVPPYVDEQRRALVDRLSSLEGAAFDREYMDAVTTRYPEMLNAMQEGSAGRGYKTGGGGPVDNPQPTGTAGEAGEAQVVEEWAAKAAPTLQTHLERAERLRERVAAAK